MLNKKILASFAFIFFSFSLLGQTPALTRLFDVRNGNGLTDGTQTYPQAITIVFKDRASADAIFDSFATQYNYQSTVPDPADATKTIANPQSKKQFAMARITSFIKEIHTAAIVSVATDTARKTAKTAVDATVPPQ